MSAAEGRAETSISGAPSAEEIASALATVLASPQFRNSLQCSSFLTYVVKYSLSGEDHLLRERVIGHEVFHRAPDYETGEDPVVRIRAAEVRKRLAQFYQGSPSRLQIEIPSGSYRVHFQVRERAAALPTPVLPAPDMSGPAAPPVEQKPTRAPEPPPVAAVPVVVLPVAPEPNVQAAPRPEPAPLPAVPLPRARRRTPSWLALAAAVCAAAGAATYLAVGHFPRVGRVERQFWGPWIQPGRPVLIAMGSNAVYRLSEGVAGRYAGTSVAPAQGWEVFPPAKDLAELRGDAFNPAENSFVALGDVAALADMVAVLARNDQHFQERFPNDISFAELRGSPAILIGGYNNPTSLELTRNLRFRLVRHNEIDDAQTPGRRWELHASLDSHDTEDYAILTRTLQQGTDAPLLSVAGMGQYGTESAAEFITTPALLAELDKVLGANWQGKNLQLVLHVKIHDFKPGRAEIVASTTW